MTKAQRALTDLEIVLDDVLDDKDEIISGWLETIAAGLAREAALVAALASLLATCMPVVSHTDCDAETLIARTPQAIENVTIDVRAYISTAEKRRLLVEDAVGFDCLSKEVVTDRNDGIEYIRIPYIAFAMWHVKHRTTLALAKGKEKEEVK